MERRISVRSRHPFFLMTLAATFAVGCSSDKVTNPTSEATSSLAQLLPDHDVLRSKLQEIVGQQNGGLGFEMWATIVDRNGRVVDVVFSGEKRTDQWPGSRAISAQKANTANAFSLDGFALSTANLYAAVQPGGSLFGLQESNPVDPKVAYAGKASDFGTKKDPMIGKRIGGINVFGGGLALYAPSGRLLGGIGLSGDTSCSDHIKAWKLRHALNLDNVPGGVAPTNTDNIIYVDGTLDGFEHPTCLDLDGQGNSVDIGNDLPTDFPVGPDE
jgi:uncharacterized protein GlcG (DUF336 family)